MAKLKGPSRLSQQRRQRARLANPHVSNGANSGANAVPADAQLAALFVQLQSADLESRSQALTSITLLCSDQHLRRLALKQNLIKIVLSNYLLDPEMSLRIASLGLLRNLVIDEGYGMAIHLWRHDIWVALSSRFTTSECQAEEYVAMVDLMNSLTLALSSEAISESFLPKLIHDHVMKGMLDKLNMYAQDQEVSMNVVTSILRFIYDLSSVSKEFLKSLCEDFNFLQASGVLYTKLQKLSQEQQSALPAMVFIIGTNFQICEFNDDLGNGQTNQVVEELFNLLSTTNGENEDGVWDTALDLFSTVIEFNGYLLEQGQSLAHKDKFTGLVNDKIIVMLSKVIGKLEKSLVCLTNAIVYLSQVGAKPTAEVETILKEINDQVTKQIGELLSNSATVKGKVNDELLDLISFKTNFFLYIIATFGTDEAVITMIKQDEQLVPLLVSQSQSQGEPSNNLIESITEQDDTLEEYLTSLVQYMGSIGKYCQDDSITQTIVEFLVAGVTKPCIEFYKNHTTKGKGNSMAKYHSNFGYIIETTLHVTLNVLMDTFDDDYSYNASLYHSQGGLGQILEEVLAEYKIIYKNIDKNSQFALKRVSEDTLMNLGRFIIYKKSEVEKN